MWCLIACKGILRCDISLFRKKNLKNRQSYDKNIGSCVVRGISHPGPQEPYVNLSIHTALPINSLATATVSIGRLLPSRVWRLMSTP